MTQSYISNIFITIMGMLIEGNPIHDSTVTYISPILYEYGVDNPEDMFYPNDTRTRLQLRFIRNDRVDELKRIIEVIKL